MWEGKEKPLLHPHWIFFFSFCFSFLTHSFTRSFLPQSREQKHIGIYFLVQFYLKRIHTYFHTHTHACVTFQSYDYNIVTISASSLSRTYSANNHHKQTSQPAYNRKRKSQFMRKMQSQIE
jgi:hypothetical protein